MEVTTSLIEFMREKCRKMGDPAERTWMHVPYSITMLGEIWTCATNGNRLTAVRGDLGLPPRSQEETFEIGLLTGARAGTSIHGSSTAELLALSGIIRNPTLPEGQKPTV